MMRPLNDVSLGRCVPRPTRPLGDASIVRYVPEGSIPYWGTWILSPNFHNHVSVSDLYIPTIGLPILLQEHMWTDPGNPKLGFSLQCIMLRQHYKAK
jgi:hypothetical protein